MLYSILPHQRVQYASLLEAMFKHRKEALEGFYEEKIDDAKDDMDDAQAIYLVYRDPKEGIIGSARLNPIITNDGIKKRCGLLAAQVLDNNSWCCTATIFGLLEKSKVWELPMEKACDQIDMKKEAFYTGLRQALDTFCCRQQVSQMLCINDSFIHGEIEEYSSLPFDLSFRDGAGKGDCNVFGLLSYSTPPNMRPN